jgi:hypothetical protein
MFADFAERRQFLKPRRKPRRHARDAGGGQHLNPAIGRLRLPMLRPAARRDKDETTGV